MPPQQRLKAFFQVALLPTDLRVLIVRRFDKMFRCMSGALLAVLRDLEHTGRLTAVNTSVLSYRELYERRARHEPSFVSDYGQSHAALMLGPLSNEEAQEEWERGGDKGMSRRLGRAYFRAALDLSGGVPSLFSKAAAYVDAVSGAADIREYRRLVVKELAPEFRRLIRYDDGDDVGMPALVESIARIQWGIGSDADVKLVRGHRWGEAFLRCTDGDLALLSPALGRCAVEMLGEIPRRVSTEALYERREYGACVQQLGGARDGSDRRGPLAIAAEMLNLAFGDSAEPLYFAADVNWKRVEALAREGMSACAESGAVDEFRGWVWVAEAMHPSGDDRDALLRKDLVRIGLRVLAVQADTNAVTSAYSAIPLIEDAFKTYVSRIHGVTPTGIAFSHVSEEELGEWWCRGRFVRPDEEARLAGASLVVLAAILSSRTGARLFEDAADAMGVVEKLDQHRNRLGHYVESPDRSVGVALADCAERILDAIAQQGGIDVSVRKLAGWVRAPEAFLPGR